MILILDNYDSFTYNLYQLVESVGFRTKVIQNDAASVEDILALAPDRIVLSPGWGTPDNTGIALDLIKQCYKRIPLLGVCLGHQCIAQAFGAEIVPSKTLMYGVTTKILFKDSLIFHGIVEPFQAARYNSLTIDGTPSGFRATAFDESGDIMAIEHEFLPVFGVQFHPESFMTTQGRQLMSNFLNG